MARSLVSRWQVVPGGAACHRFSRLYIYEPSDKEALLETLREKGYRLESLPFPVQLWSGRRAVGTPADGIEIEAVTEANFEECMQVESIAEFGGRKIREKAFAMEFAHPDFVHYLLRVKGEPASSLCLFRAGQYVRVENVATLPAYRGQGLIGHLLHHVQQEFVRMGGEQLWVCPINDRVERVYSRYGFETVGQLPFVHAFLGGAGVLELRA